jgi:hypothetical protein
LNEFFFGEVLFKFFEKSKLMHNGWHRMQHNKEKRETDDKRKKK